MEVDNFELRTCLPEVGYELRIGDLLAVAKLYMNSRKS